MHGIISPMLAISAGFLIFVFGCKMSLKKLGYLSGNTVLDTIFSLLMHTLDAAVTLFFCMFEYTNVIIILLGLFLMAFGIHEMY